MQFNRIIWAGCGILAALWLCGCQSTPTRPQPLVAATVPVRYFRVLGAADSTTSPQGNFGCRFDDVELRLFQQAIAKHCYTLFDSAARFVPVIDPTGDIHDVLIPVSVWGNPFPPTGARNLAQQEIDFLLLLYYPDTFPDMYGIRRDGDFPGEISAYFVGNFQPPSVSRLVLGQCFDPRDRQVVGLPYFYVNDTGFELTSGFPAGFGSEFVRAGHIVEHELTHYLARFNGRTFSWSAAAGPSNPPVIRPFDLTEHAIHSDTADGSGTQILDILKPAAPHPLLVFGRRADGPQGPLGEIVTRLRNQLWDNP